jgi:hypothetical protein
VYLGSLGSQSLEDSLETTSAPHVDLAPLLGLDGPLRVGVGDVDALLRTGVPAFHISLDKTTLTVHREDGGLMATLALRF